jgi:hypothetical protein
MLFTSRYSFAIIFCVLLGACNPNNNDISLLSSYPVFGSCAIDTPQANTTLSPDQDFTVGGWAYNEKNKSIPDNLTLYFINENTSVIFTFPAKRGTKRPDVATAFELPQLVDSGFNGFVSKNSLPTGTYRIVVLQASRESGVILCNGLNHKIIIQ